MNDGTNGESRPSSSSQDEVTLFLSALQEHGLEPEPLGSGYRCVCPAHNDSGQQLLIERGTKRGRAMLECTAGCARAAILAEIGLEEIDGSLRRARELTAQKDDAPLAGEAHVHESKLHPQRSKPHHLQLLADELGVSVESLDAIGFKLVEGEWRNPERNAEGEVIGWVRRLAGGEKLTVEGGRRGLTTPCPLPPYAGTSPDDPILIVEGASDTAAGLDLGFVTIGRPSCSGGAKLLKAVLSGLHVVIVAENDEAGIKGADKLASEQLPDCASVRAILPPTGCKDLRTWLRSGTREAIRAAVLEEIEQAEPYKHVAPASRTTESVQRRATPIMRRASDIEPEEIDWLWPGRIPIGKVTVIAGDPGMGKSFVTIDLIARASAGWALPGTGSPYRRRVGVVLFNAEDDAADTIRPRLDAAEADNDRVTILEGVRNADGTAKGFTLDDLDVLEQAIDATPDCALVVIDPLGAVYGETNSHKDSDVRALMAPLVTLAAQKKVAIVLIAHLNKAQGRRASHRLTGSMAVVAAARMGWLVAEDPSDPDRRLMVNIKANITQGSTGLAFTVTGSPATIEWEETPIEMSADELLASGSDEGARSEIEEAKAFLQEELAGGPRAVQEIERAAKEAMIAPATLKRAKKQLAIESKKTGMDGGWEWSLPEGDHDSRSGSSLCDDPLRPS